MRGRRAGGWLPRARAGDACAHVKLVFLTGRARPAELSYSRRSSGAAPPLRGPTKHLIRPIRCGSHRKRGVRPPTLNEDIVCFFEFSWAFIHELRGANSSRCYVAQALSVATRQMYL